MTRFALEMGAVSFDRRRPFSAIRERPVSGSRGRAIAFLAVARCELRGSETIRPPQCEAADGDEQAVW